MNGRLEVWNDSLAGDYLWTRENLSEAVPNVMTPATWSLFETYFIGEAWRPLTAVPDHRVVGNIGGRAYVNLSLFRSLGGERVVRQTMGEAFGHLSSIDTIPPLPMARWRVAWAVTAKAPRFARAVFPYLWRFGNRVDAVRDRSVAVHGKVRAAATADELTRLWRGEIDPLLRAASRLFAAGGRQGGTAVLTLGSWLRKRAVSDADVNALLTTEEPSSLVSLGPVLGLEQLRHGHIDADTYAAQWGHRCPDEFEVTAPRPAEEDAWIDQRLAVLGHAPIDVADLLHRRQRERAAALDRFARAHPRRARALRRRMRRAANGFRGREAGRNEVNRAFSVARTFWLRAGELTGLGNDLAFLTFPEVLGVLEGDTKPLRNVASRRHAFDNYRALPPYPVLIRGHFDLDKWAARSGRDAEPVGNGDARVSNSEMITGFPGAVGVVKDGRASSPRLTTPTRCSPAKSS